MSSRGNLLDFWILLEAIVSDNVPANRTQTTSRTQRKNSKRSGASGLCAELLSLTLISALAEQLILRQFVNAQCPSSVARQTYENIRG
jgi:hypothetical protein